jgi:hypothetical protein
MGAPGLNIAETDQHGSTASAQPLALKKVLVLSYLNVHNFGDRLGYHVINGLLPAGVQVTHGALNFVNVPDDHYDLLILGLGHSLNAPAMQRPELQRFIETVPHTLGIFGTQYRNQYREAMDPRLFGALLDRMTMWWARYEDDISIFGGGRSNVRHLGDWLISAFPMTTPTFDKTLTIPADIVKSELPLDRMIQRIQAYRRVSTARIHPMLCALTSAQEVAFQDQREMPGSAAESGKFRAQLRDIFGRAFEENTFFKVDRAAVVRYKIMVEANMAALRAQICALLDYPQPILSLP